MRAWFAAGSWAVALCALGLAIGSPARSAAQATDDSAEAAEADAPADGTTPEAPVDAAASDGDASESDEAAEAEATTEAAPEGGASELGSSSTALNPGDVEAEEAAAEGTEAVDDEEAAEEQQAAREPLPWRNTFFSWTHGTTPNTFLRDAQLSYDPLYYWSFNLAPRWYLDAQTFFFLSQSLSYELTDDGAGSPYNRDLALSDTIVELRRVAVAEGFIFIPAVRVVLPLSKLSQAAQRYLGLGAGVTAVRVIPEAASLTIAAIGRYQYSFAGRNTPALQGSVPGETAPPIPEQTPVVLPPATGTDIGSFNDQGSPLSTARHTITAGLSLSVTPVSGLTVSASAFFLAMEGHGLGDGCTRVETSPTGWICFGDQSATHWRTFTSYSLSVAYDITAWFNLSVGWSNSTVLAPVLNNDGTVRSPFNPDNNLFLSASFQIDAIYEALAGAEDDGLTPEQRQRRRQGLSRRISGEEGSF